MNFQSLMCTTSENSLLHFSLHILLPATTWAILLFVAYREWRARRRLAIEIQDKMQVEQSLQRRSRYLKALAEVNQLLLSHPGYRETYEGILRLLGLASGASRVYIFENHTAENGTLLSSRRADWCAPGIAPHSQQTESPGLFSPGSPCRRWLALLQQGKPVTGNLQELPREECLFLENEKVLSILLLPMLVNSEFFGFIGFDQCDREREWQESELYFLQSVALTLSQHIERQQALDQIAEQQLLLEERVKSRTEQLLLANEELEAFCYTVSHDLRGPLTGIRGFSQLLLEELGDNGGSERDYIYRVLDITDRTLQLVDDLLGLSRAARSDLQRNPVDISSIAENISAELQLQYPERTVTFTISKGLTAIGDEGLIKVVMQNLINNAWKYTSKKPSAEIEIGCRTEAGEQFFYVRDNGAGFKMEYVDRLFQAFCRLHTAHEFPGTGVGLATVRRIIQRHGGSVRAEGEVDKGATFYFTLPDIECT